MGKVIAEMDIESVTMELPDTKTIRLKWPAGYGGENVDRHIGASVRDCVGRPLALKWPVSLGVRWRLLNSFLAGLLLLTIDIARPKKNGYSCKSKKY